MTANLTIKCPNCLGITFVVDMGEKVYCKTCNGTGQINPEISASQILSSFLRDGYIDKTKMENSLFYSSSAVQEIVKNNVNDYKQKVRDVVLETLRKTGRTQYKDFDEAGDIESSDEVEFIIGQLKKDLKLND